MATSAMYTSLSVLEGNHIKRLFILLLKYWFNLDVWVFGNRSLRKFNDKHLLKSYSNHWPFKCWEKKSNTLASWRASLRSVRQCVPFAIKVYTMASNVSIYRIKWWSNRELWLQRMTPCNHNAVKFSRLPSFTGHQSCSNASILHGQGIA